MSTILRCRTLAAAFVLAGLGACSILPPAVQRTAYVLPHTPVTVDAQLPKADWRLRLGTPHAVSGVDNRQWWVVSPDASVGAYRDVLWAENAPVMVRERLMSIFLDSGRFNGVNNTLSDLSSDYELESNLRAFRVERNSGNGGTVYVRLDANLLHLNSRVIVASQQFVKRVDVPNLEVETLVNAYAKAVDSVASQALVWTIEEGNSGLQRLGSAWQPQVLKPTVAQ